MILEKIKKENDIKELSEEELAILADEIREFLIQKISVTGGHLASNLGVVELTMALHLFLDLPKDKLICHDMKKLCRVARVNPGSGNVSSWFDLLWKQCCIKRFDPPICIECALNVKLSIRVGTMHLHSFNADSQSFGDGFVR